MELALIVNGEEINCFDLIDGDNIDSIAFNRASEVTVMDQAYLALKHDSDAEVKIHIRNVKKQYLTYRFDVTDLTDEQRNALAGEVCCQAEASDGHPSVPMETDYDEVTL